MGRTLLLEPIPKPFAASVSLGRERGSARFWDRFLVTVLALATGQASGQDLPQVKIPFPPKFGYAKIGGNGDVKIAYYVARPVWETRTKEQDYTVTVVADGKSVPEQRTRTVPYTGVMPCNTERLPESC